MGQIRIELHRGPHRDEEARAVASPHVAARANLPFILAWFGALLAWSATIYVAYYLIREIISALSWHVGVGA